MTNGDPGAGRAPGGGRRLDGPVPVSEALAELSERIGIAGPDVLGVVFGGWEEVVGAALAAHVRPLRLHDDTLVVVADHPAWATQVRHLSADILVKLADACAPRSGPNRLEVRVRA